MGFPYPIHILGRTLNQQWVLIVASTKVLSTSFYPCLPHYPIHIFEKKMDNAKTKNVGPNEHFQNLGILQKCP